MVCKKTLWYLKSSRKRSWWIKNYICMSKRGLKVSSHAILSCSCAGSFQPWNEGGKLAKQLWDFQPAALKTLTFSQFCCLILQLDSSRLLRRAKRHQKRSHPSKTLKTFLHAGSFGHRGTDRETVSSQSVKSPATVTKRFRKICFIFMCNANTASVYHLSVEKWDVHLMMHLKYFERT